MSQIEIPESLHETLRALSHKHRLTELEMVVAKDRCISAAKSRWLPWNTSGRMRRLMLALTKAVQTHEKANEELWGTIGTYYPEVREGSYALDFSKMRLVQKEPEGPSQEMIEKLMRGMFGMGGEV